MDKTKYDESRAKEIRLATRAAENVDKVCDLADHPIDQLFPVSYTMKIDGRLRRLRAEVNYT